MRKAWIKFSRLLSEAIDGGSNCGREVPKISPSPAQVNHPLPPRCSPSPAQGAAAITLDPVGAFLNAIWIGIHFYVRKLGPELQSWPRPADLQDTARPPTPSTTPIPVSPGPPWFSQTAGTTSLSP